jgi:hypothetical protein
MQYAVSEQRLGKHVPAETNTHATIENGVSDVVRVEKLQRRQSGQSSAVELCKGGREKTAL